MAPSAQNKSSNKELTSTEKVPYPAGTIMLATRLEPREGNWQWALPLGSPSRATREPGARGNQEVAVMTQQWDTSVSEEKPTEKARAIRARQRAIGRELRRLYDEVAQEPVPDEFLDLLRQIDEANDGKKVS